MGAKEKEARNNTRVRGSRKGNAGYADNRDTSVGIAQTNTHTEAKPATTVRAEDSDTVQATDSPRARAKQGSPVRVKVSEKVYPTSSLGANRGSTVYPTSRFGTTMTRDVCAVSPRTTDTR